MLTSSDCRYRASSDGQVQSAQSSGELTFVTLLSYDLHSADALRLSASATSPTYSSNVPGSGTGWKPFCDSRAQIATMQ
jgi:hypothetical protein